MHSLGTLLCLRPWPQTTESPSLQGKNSSLQRALPGLCGSLYYNFMMKLWVPLHSVLVQILTCTDNSHKQLWVTRVLGIIFHPGTELSFPRSEKDDPENKCQWHFLVILTALQSCHRSQATIIPEFSDDEICHYCQTGLTGLFGHFLKIQVNWVTNPTLLYLGFSRSFEV